MRFVLDGAKVTFREETSLGPHFWAFFYLIAKLGGTEVF
jgi:hypothetical protein